jgi:hypothetical protein
MRYPKVANALLTPSFFAAKACRSFTKGETALPFQLAIGPSFRLICPHAAALAFVLAYEWLCDRREIRTMASIGQGWIEEAIPTRDGALAPAARLLRSILLLTSP